MSLFCLSFLMFMFLPGFHEVTSLVCLPSLASDQKEVVLIYLKPTRFPSFIHGRVCGLGAHANFVDVQVIISFYFSSGLLVSPLHMCRSALLAALLLVLQSLAPLPQNLPVDGARQGVELVWEYFQARRLQTVSVSNLTFQQLFMNLKSYQNFYLLLVNFHIPEMIVFLQFCPVLYLFFKVC